MRKSNIRILAAIAVMAVAVWAASPVSSLGAGAEKPRKTETKKKKKSRKSNPLSFAKDKAGSVPKGWQIAETSGKKKTAKWEVVADKSATGAGKVVAITANENRGQTYNLLIAKETRHQDLNVSVRVRAIAGKEDQGGGPIWRAKDANNYYIARWNPLEDNFRVYYVKDGKRRQIGTADVKADPKAWHTIAIVHRGPRIVAKLDGKTLIRVSDTTFPEAGKVGLWVKADGRTAFSNFRAREVKAGDKAKDAKAPKKERKKKE